MRESLECSFEAEVLASILESRWPERVDEELRVHVSHCPICSDVLCVANAMQESRQGSRDTADLPDAGRVWWLAHVRKRREAVGMAGRPITVAQVLAFACAVALLGSCFGAALAALWSSAIAIWATHAQLVIVLVCLLLLAPVPVYLVGGRD